MSSFHSRHKAIPAVLVACVLACNCNSHAFEQDGKSPVEQVPTVASDGAHVSNRVVFPGDKWDRITPEQAGLDVEKFNELLRKANVHPGGWGGTEPTDKQWGAVLTRGGYIVHTWGDPKYKTQSASLGKCITRALFGLSVEAGVIKPDEPICKTWTGRDELSHPHKYLDNEAHRTLTWRHLLDHQGGFVLESGFHWRKHFRHTGGSKVPAWVKWTGDPLFDNYSHTLPGAETGYSSGGYVRLGQALTAAWKGDLKDVLDERLFQQIGIPAGRWDWLPGEVVHDTKDFYPAIPNYGEYVGPPYKINDHIVRGGPGWVVMSAEDLARLGLLISNRGIWKGKRLIGEKWLRGHAGLDIHVVAGDPETTVSIAKINTKGFPFGQKVGVPGSFSFPKELIAGPVDLKRGQGSQPKHEVKVERPSANRWRTPHRSNQAKSTSTPSASGKQAWCSRRVTASAWKSPAVISHGSPATSTRACRDEKYPAMFRELVCSWWDDLPLLAAKRSDGVKVIWNSGLGSSIRGLNMMDAYYLMRKSPEFTDELHEKILRIFLGHSRYMSDTRLHAYTHWNGQATQCCWATMAAILLPEFRDSGKWLNAAVRLTEQRVMENYDADGAQLEMCPQYHFAGMRDITRVVWMLARNSMSDRMGDVAFRKKLELIYDFPIRLTHPTGHGAVMNSGVYGNEWLAFMPIGVQLFDSKLQGWAAIDIAPGLRDRARLGHAQG